MAKFSESFFESLRGAGRRGSPTDPMLQRQAGPQYGSTDPLARSLGGMLGMDMRTAPELATAELSKVDQTDPNSLIQALGVQAKYEQDPQKKVLYMLEIDKIKKEIAKENELKALNDQKNERYSAMAKLVSEKSPELAKLISLGGEEAYKAGLKIMTPSETLSLKDRYLQVGKRVFDASTGDFVGGLPSEAIKYESKTIYNPETQQNEIIWVDPANPNKVVRRDVAQRDEDKQSSAAFKRQSVLTTAALDYDAQYRRAMDVVQQAETLNPKGGAYATVAEIYKSVSGSRDKVTALREAASRLKTTQAVSNLPTGPASDKDIALVLQGEAPTESSSGEYLAQYARGIAKLAKRAATDARDNNAWLSAYKDERGFLENQRMKVRQDELSALVDKIGPNGPAALQLLSEGGAAALPAFTAEYKDIIGADYNPLEAIQELQRNKQILANLEGIDGKKGRSL